MKKKTVGFDSRLEFVAFVMNGDGGVEVSLSEVVVLKRHDGGGVWIGVEIVRVVADHASKIGEDVGRENVLISDDAHGLKVIGGLELASRLLNLLIGEFKAGKCVANAQSEMVFGREVAGEGEREISSGAAVGEIFRNHRIEVASGHVARGAGAEGVMACGELELCEGSGGIEAAAGEDEPDRGDRAAGRAAC